MIKAIFPVFLNFETHKMKGLQQSTSQLPIINSLRGLAALMVAFHHFSRWGDLKGGLYAEGDLIPQIGFYGNLGVYIFFVISGFVIPYTLIQNNYKIRNFFRFILKRSIRIEIPYIASIICLLVVHYISSRLFSWVHFSIEPKRFLLHLFYLIPFTDYKWYSIIYWTLAVEFQYYLLIALIIPVFIHRNRLIQTIALLGFTSLIFFRLLDSETAYVYSHTGIFAMGIVTCLFYLKRASLWQFMLILIYGSILTWYFRNGEIAIAAFLTSLIICFVKFDFKIGDFFGKISYSLYLTHILTGQFFIELAMWYWKLPIPNHLILLTSLTIAIISAWVFWKLIENPSKQLASRISIHKP